MVELRPVLVVRIARRPRARDPRLRLRLLRFPLARWPVPNSPGKQRAYEKALEAYWAYAKKYDPPLEVVRVPYEGTEVVGYVRMPKNAKNVPFIIAIAGLTGVMLASAALDRLAHNAHQLVITGDSYRAKGLRRPTTREPDRAA